MPLFSRLHGHYARIFERFKIDEESRDRLDEGRLNITEKEWNALKKAARRKWHIPEQLPITAETVFLSQFRRGPVTIDDAWNGLSLEKRERYTAKAKKNEICNTAKFADFNKRYQLLPFAEDIMLSEEPRSRRGYFLQLMIGSRRIALQRWKSYRSDHPRACGGRKTPVPETPFRIMDLPFELRREIFSLVLIRSYPVLQFPPDGSADATNGPIDVRLFAVSRQVFEEAVREFYEVNVFGIITDTSRFFKDLPLFMRQSTGNEAPRPTESTKRVHVSFHENKVCIQTDEFRFLWKKFCGFLRTCKNLRKVEIAVQWLVEGHGAEDLGIDKMVEILMTIRDTKEILFSDVTTSAAFAQNHLGVLYRTVPFRRITIITVNRCGDNRTAMFSKETQPSTA